MDNFDNNDIKPQKFELDDVIPDEAVENSSEKEKKKNTFGQEVLEWLDVLCVAIIGVIIVFSLVFRVATIDGSSMLNTLSANDKVIITNFNYTPKQGDIVVISRNKENSVETQKDSDEPIIKRVIAVGGQTVNIENGIVTVDDVPLKEDYIGGVATTAYDSLVKFPLHVPEGYIFVLGDNRGASLDSRSHTIGKNGLIDTRYVLGHAVYRIFPFNKTGKVD